MAKGRTKWGAWSGWDHYVETAKNQAKYGSGGTMQDIGHAILGGPAGMLNAALGQRNPVSKYASFSTHLAHSELAESQYGRQIFESMEDDEHQAFENMETGARQEFINRRTAELSKPKAPATPDAADDAVKMAKVSAWKRLQLGKKRDTSFATTGTLGGFDVSKPVLGGY